MRKYVAGLLLTVSRFTDPACAQQTEDHRGADAAQITPAPLDEIVVTAQRRPETVQDVPISVTVVGAEQLERQQVTELRDLSRSAPSVEFGAAAGANPGGGASIRGIGTTSFGRAAEAAVGVVVDGVVQGNANTNNLFDIARVEVLRGPQGTLFGQSVSAGVINITTNAPKLGTFEGRFATELSANGFAGSEYGRQVARGVLNVPVSAESALRVSLFGARTDGVTRDVYLGRNEHQYEQGARARYLLKLGEAVTFNLIGDYNRSLTKNGGFFVYGGAAPGTNAAAFNAACGVVPSLENFDHCSDFPSRVVTKTYGASGQFDVDLGRGLTLVSISALRRQDFGLSQDIDRLPENLTTLNISSLSDTEIKQFTQEVRLQSDPQRPLSLVVGAYYQNSDTSFLAPGTAGATIYFARAGLPGPPVLRSFSSLDSETNLKNISGFGEVNFHIGGFTTFGGLRVNRNEIETNNVTQNIQPVTTPVAFSSGSLKDTNVSWRAGAKYDITRDMMVFGTVSRGYKSGQVFGEQGTPRNILPERPLDFQLGVKTELFNRRLAINLTGFYTKVVDFQATVTTVNASTGVVSAAPMNINKVVTKGVELEMFGRLGRHINVNAGVLYNDARYPAGFRAIDGGLIEGQQIASAPRFKFTSSTEYFTPITDRLSFIASADVAYKSRTRLGLEQANDYYTYYKGYAIVGGRIGVRANDDRWSVALFVKNVGNVAAPYSIGAIPQPVGDPPGSSRHVFQNAGGRRQVGLQGGVNF